ncbi:CTP synthetase [Halorientalis sp. IM1011]|uniref:DUF7126 family protein n=1 Tax=Halorientalis sp. IM1011 TaxID=1932360 RepID=UPI00097CCAE1|nr:CTP synthetase [Halorientalis sp. IM1011]AQL43506.1 CTP synthetase [Halorientalis sp. IM1011]
MNAVIAGPDEHDLGAALTEAGFTVTRAAGTANRPALEEAGIHDADLFVLTDAALATAIPVATDLTDDLRIVAYTTDSLPEFVKGQAHMALDPELFDPADVAEEAAEAAGD